jgi:hypothetical protein
MSQPRHQTNSGLRESKALQGENVPRYQDAALVDFYADLVDPVPSSSIPQGVRGQTIRC